MYTAPFISLSFCFLIYFVIECSAGDVSDEEKASDKEKKSEPTPMVSYTELVGQNTVFIHLSYIVKNLEFCCLVTNSAWKRADDFFTFGIFTFSMHMHHTLWLVPNLLKHVQRAITCNWILFPDYSFCSYMVIWFHL